MDEDNENLPGSHRSSRSAVRILHQYGQQFSSFTDSTRLSFHIADYDRSFWTVEPPPMKTIRELLFTMMELTDA